MRFHYDKKADALYIRLSEKRYFESEEIAKGVIFDYDRASKIIGIEILDASKKFPEKLQTSLNGKLPFVFKIDKAESAVPVAR